METLTKTPVQIIQELISVHTNRIEMVQKCEGKPFAPNVAARLASAKQQSEQYTAELMNELSLFGDAVMASVDHQNEYQRMYKNVLGNIDALTPQEAEQTFQSLEAALQHIYQTIVETETELPDSLAELLRTQTKGLEAR